MPHDVTCMSGMSYDVREQCLECHVTSEKEGGNEEGGNEEGGLRRRVEMRRGGVWISDVIRCHVTLQPFFSDVM